MILSIATWVWSDEDKAQGKVIKIKGASSSTPLGNSHYEKLSIQNYYPQINLREYYPLHFDWFAALRELGDFSEGGGELLTMYALLQLPKVPLLLATAISDECHEH